MQFLFSTWENRSPVAVPCPRLHNAAGLSTAVGGVEIFWRCPETFGRWGHHKIGAEAGLTSQSGHGCWVGALRKEGLLLEARELGAGERWVWPHGRHSDPSS